MVQKIQRQTNGNGQAEAIIVKTPSQTFWPFIWMPPTRMPELSAGSTSGIIMTSKDDRPIPAIILILVDRNLSWAWCHRAGSAVACQVNGQMSGLTGAKPDPRSMHGLSFSNINFTYCFSKIEEAIEMNGCCFDLTIGHGLHGGHSEAARSAPTKPERNSEIARHCLPSIRICPFKLR